MSDALAGKEVVLPGRTRVPGKTIEFEPQSILRTIDSPADLRRLQPEQLKPLAAEIRHYILDVVSRKGGHLAPSLGVVELTLALHYLYDTPKDRILWDVGHQAYVHKVITGRRDRLPSIRQQDGLSGFCRRSESEYDVFGAGHASTSISAALGFAAARDLSSDDFEVVAVTGDGAMTGGLAYEAMNNAGQQKRNILVILNDNEMSISPNVGAISRYLTDLQTSPFLNRIRDEAFNGHYHGGRRAPAGEEHEDRAGAGRAVPGPGFPLLRPGGRPRPGPAAADTGEGEDRTRSGAAARGHQEGQGVPAGGGGPQHLAWRLGV
jgi:transketolase N-terminal domain/subunit